MDHLPWPDNVSVPPLEIPFICGEILELNAEEFLDYPIDMGWSTHNEPFQWINSSPDVVSRRAQSWLFFGLLQVLTGNRVDPQEYIVPSQRLGNRVISTRLLPKHCSEWVRLVNANHGWSNGELLTRDYLRTTWNGVYLKAKLHFEVLNSHLAYETNPTLLLIAESIPILLQTMQRVAHEISLFHEEGLSMCDIDLQPSSSPLRRMLDLGWCAAQAGNIYRFYSPAVNHYLSGLPRHHLNNHDNGCTWNQCVANNVNEDSYETQHTREACSCPSVGPDPLQIAGLIEDDRIPLVSLRVVAGKPELNLIAAERKTKYVSISHVWAGGLGNFKQNKLPSCQLLRLYRLLDDLNNFRPPEPKFRWFERPPWLESGIRIWTSFGDAGRSVYALASGVIDRAFRGYTSQPDLCQPIEVYFWMDTLCIPVLPEHRPLRIKAINNMSLIYTAAERCLVLDPELQQIHMNNLSPIQINAHVLCCTWQTRSWTFQEARLSRAWFALFADGFYNPNSQENALLHRRIYGHWNIVKSDAHNLASEVISWYTDMPAMRQTDIIANQSSRIIHDDFYNFICIWNHLVSRSTSKMEDVNGILANTLDLNAAEVINLPPEQRMKAIFNSQDKLPAGLVFNDARKVPDPYSRWVPLYPEDDVRLSEFLYGTLTRSNTGFYLDNIKGNPVGFLVDPSVPRHRKIRLLDSSDYTIPPLWIRFNTKRDDFPFDCEAPSSEHNKTLAVVYLVGDLRKSLEDQGVGRSPQGARFALKRKEGKTLHLVWEHSFHYNHQRVRQFRESADVYATVKATRTEEGAVFHVECKRDEWPILKKSRDSTSSLTSHGLHYYLSFGMVWLFAVWTPFYYLGMRTRHLVIPTAAFVGRFCFAYREFWDMVGEVNEHAYKSWIKTFDETGSFRTNDDDSYRKGQVEIEQKDIVALGLAMGILALAVLGDGMGYLVWIAMALVVERGGLWLLRWVWRRTRVKGWVKGFLKRRRWW